MNSTTTRVLSALVLLPLVIAMIWYAPPILLRVFIVFVAGLAVFELQSLIPPIAWRAVAAVIWVFIPLLLIGEIRDHQGPQMVMLLLGTLVASDSAQYFVGRAVGRHKLAPSISPSKTIEGAIGGAIVAPLAAVLIARYYGIVPEWKVGIVAVLMAIAGMAGDLFESHVKRRAGVKDSGNVIPGHGGILDRIDSWLFATPVLFVCLLWLW